MKVIGTRSELSDAFAAVPESWRFPPYQELVQAIWKGWETSLSLTGYSLPVSVIELDINDEKLVQLVTAQLIANRLCPKDMP